MTPSSLKDDFSLPLGGTVYRFHWGVDELIEMQERLATPLSVPSVQMMDLGIRQGRLKYLRAMMWAGLRTYNPTISEKDVGGLMQAATEDEMRALLRAFGYAIAPDPKDAEALTPTTKKTKNPRKAQTKRTTGATSIAAPGATV